MPRGTLDEPKCPHLPPQGLADGAENSGRRCLDGSSTSSIDAQFESLEAHGQQSEIEARLAALKARDGERIVSSAEL